MNIYSFFLIPGMMRLHEHGDPLQLQYFTKNRVPLIFLLNKKKRGMNKI